MLQHILPSKKLAAVVASMGLAGVAGLSGCKSSHSHTAAGCCHVCAPAPCSAVGCSDQPAATSPAEGAAPSEQTPAPPADPAVTAETPESSYDGPTTAAEAAALWEDLGGVVEFDSTGSIGVLDLSQTTVGDHHLRGATGLEQLSQLDLSNTLVTDAALAEANWMSLLTRLSLNGTQVTDAGLQHVRELQRLRLLWLNETAVGDAGLAHLANLGGLQSLGLNKTEVTDAGMAHLQNLKDLQYLLLGHTQITDAGLKQLRGLRNLKGLSLVGTRVTPVGVAELQAALPDCQIVADPVEDAASEQEELEETPPLEFDDPQSRLSPQQIHGGRPRIHQAVWMAAPQLPLPTERGPVFTSQGGFAADEAADITRFYIGLALAEVGDMRSALPLFVETVGEAAGYYNIGVLLCKAGYWDEGERYLRAALELDPQMSAAQKWLREIERERDTVMSPPEFQQVHAETIPSVQAVRVKSPRHSDTTPPPIGVWMKR